MSYKGSDTKVVFNIRDMQESEYETPSEASVVSSAPPSRHRRRQRTAPFIYESKCNLKI